MLTPLIKLITSLQIITHERGPRAIGRTRLRVEAVAANTLESRTVAQPQVQRRLPNCEFCEVPATATNRLLENHYGAGSNLLSLGICAGSLLTRRGCGSDRAAALPLRCGQLHP